MKHILFLTKDVNHQTWIAKRNSVISATKSWSWASKRSWTIASTSSALIATNRGALRFAPVAQTNAAVNNGIKLTRKYVSA